MSRVNRKLAEILSKLQNRLTRTSTETHQNTDAIAALRDEVRLKVGQLQQWNTDIVAQFEERFKVSKYLNEANAERINRVENENNEREKRQVVRDQSNVQSLVNLRDSTARAFDQVKKDVETLLHQIQRLNERTGQVESQKLALASTVSLIQNRTADQNYVNTKLQGVYDVTADLEKRLQEIEEQLAPPVNYLGYKIRSAKGSNILIVDGKEFFPFPAPIVALDSQPFGVVVTLSNDDQYILCGGPSPVTMFVNSYKIVDRSNQAGKCVA